MENLFDEDDLSWWRPSRISLIQYSGHQVGDVVNRERKMDVFLFRNAPAVIVSTAIMRFRDWNESSKNGILQSTTPYVACINGWVATSILFLQNTDGGRERPKKPFLRDFSRLLPVAVTQILRNFRSTAEQNHSEELESW